MPINVKNKDPQNNRGSLSLGPSRVRHKMAHGNLRLAHYALPLT